MTTSLPRTPDDYINCFRILAAITNKALDHIENQQNWVSDNDRNKSLRRAAEAVETIASLRGDSGCFYDSRPDGLTQSYQKEMYATEDLLRSRLVSLGYKYPNSSSL